MGAWLLLVLVLGLFPSAYSAGEDSCLTVWSQPINVSDITIAPDPGQILIQGELRVRTSTGMEGLPEWTVLSDTHNGKMLPNFEDHIWYLSDGDQIFVWNPNGTLRVSGYFKLTSSVGMTVWQQHETSYNSFKPHLFSEPDFKTVRLEHPELAKMFLEESRVTVRHNLSSQEQSWIQGWLQPHYKRFLEHTKDPSRFIQISEDVRYELAHFERVVEGTLSWHIEPEGPPPDIHGFTLWEAKQNPSGSQIRLTLHSQGRSFRLTYGHRVYFLDRQGNLLVHTILSADSDPIGHADTLTKKVDLFQSTARVIAIGGR